MCKNISVTFKVVSYDTNSIIINLITSNILLKIMLLNYLFLRKQFNLKYVLKENVLGDLLVITHDKLLWLQLTFDSFTLGKFVSFTAEGCPDGSLQISEAQRPDVGGLWCGTSWGPAIYYSETPSVSIILKLLRLSKDQTGFNFDFRMAYKMIRKSDAVVRYGNPFVGRWSASGYRFRARSSRVWFATRSTFVPCRLVFYFRTLVSNSLETSFENIFADWTLFALKSNLTSASPLLWILYYYCHCYKMSRCNNKYLTCESHERAF